MVDKQSSKASKTKTSNAAKRRSTMSSDRYAYLRAEAKAPYRILRQFIYVAFAGSGFIGAVVFLADLVAARDVANALPNLALQLGVLALMIWLLKIDRPAKTD